MWRPPTLFVPWAVLAVVCSVLMWLSPGEETIPLHIGWVGLCVSYGFALWPPTVTIASIAAYASISGAVLMYRAQQHILGWQETAEIPLMALMALVMAWHVARRVESIRVVSRVAEAERTRHTERERLSRMYSHEMRTPLTIARGYLNLLQQEPLTAAQHEDLAVVDDELGTLERVGHRLLRMLAATDLRERDEVDLDELVAEVGRRWSTVTERQWVVASDAGTLTCSRERVRMCLDTMVENALRYTDADDAVRIYATSRGDRVEIGVADSGPGLSDDVVADIAGGAGVATALDEHGVPVGDTRRQTGLGLELVRQVALSHGGVLVARRAQEGGALVGLLVPRRVGSGTLLRPGAEGASAAAGVVSPAR